MFNVTFISVTVKDSATLITDVVMAAASGPTGSTVGFING